MTTRDMTRTPVAARPPDRWPEVNSGHASQVIEALDQIVGRSRRASPLRRAAGGIRRALAGWLERAVSATPPPEGSDLPPQIRFPFF